MAVVVWQKTFSRILKVFSLLLHDNVNLSFPSMIIQIYT